MASFTLNQVTSIASAYAQGVERGGYMYVPRYNGGSVMGSVNKIDMSTNTVTSTIDLGTQSASGGAFFLSLDNNSDIVVTNQDGVSNAAGGSIQKISTSDVVSTFVTSSVAVSSGYRAWQTFFCNGNYYSLGSTSGGVTQLTKITTGGVRSSLSVTDIGISQAGVVIGTNIYVTSASNSNVYKLDCTTDTFTNFATGTGVSGSLSKRDTNLYYSRNGEGYTVNLSSGAMTLIDTLTTGKELYLTWASNSFIYSVTTSAGLNKSTTTYGAISSINSSFFNFF